MDEQPSSTPERVHDLLNRARIAEQEAEGLSARARQRLAAAERLRGEARALIRDMMASKSGPGA